MNMTEIEARGKIKYRIANEMRKYGENKEEYEDLEIALQVMKEIREYRAIGTVEELQAFRSDDFTQYLLNMGYTKGLKDGYAKAIDEFAERIKQGDVIEYMGSYVSYKAIVSFIDEIAEQMKGGATDEC